MCLHIGFQHAFNEISGAEELIAMVILSLKVLDKLASLTTLYVMNIYLRMQILNFAFLKYRLHNNFFIAEGPFKQTSVHFYSHSILNIWADSWDYGTYRPP